MYKSYQKYCPKCGGFKIIKKGFKDRIQIYKCKECNHKFHNNKRVKDMHYDSMWIDYVFHKQTIRELKKKYNLNKKTVVNILNNYEYINNKIHKLRILYLVVDATYFGSRKDNTSWGVLLFRDKRKKENIWWKFIDKESAVHYEEGLKYILDLGYSIKSVTCDGFKSNRHVFKDYLIQMCHFHMKQIIIRNISLNPKTIPGQLLLALIKELKNMNLDILRERLRLFYIKYHDFMYEKTIHPSGDSSYTHEGVLSAYKSFSYWCDLLYTYKYDNKIPKTTNTCEGHFSHIKDILRIHRGLSKDMKEKVINTIFSHNSISPKDI